jgi:hypothetical protein
MLLLVCLVGIISINLHGQDRKVTLKDTLDDKLDLSNYVVNLHGFVPVPMIISEPALGSFGGALALVFMSPKKSAGKDQQFRFPDITGVAGMYTLNNTWGVGVLRQGSFPKIRMRYTAAVGYADANMNFYREVPVVGEKEFLFNMKTWFAMLDISENLYKNKIFSGLRYQFASMQASYDFSQLGDSIFDNQEFDKDLGTLGIYGEWDSRNSIFTPDRGFRIKATANIARSWTGSDFDLERYELYTTVFLQPTTWWVCGLKAEGTAVSEGAPFYYYPFLIMRGIPMMRYQGQQTLLFETEQRFDVTRRWSLVGFLGTGRTFSEEEFMKDEQWHTAGGAGFRYLVARLFNLRMGIDVATGPDQFAYYIVFGHYWNR